METMPAMTRFRELYLAITPSLNHHCARRCRGTSWLQKCSEYSLPRTPCRAPSIFATSLRPVTSGVCLRLLRNMRREQSLHITNHRHLHCTTSQQNMQSTSPDGYIDRASHLVQTSPLYANNVYSSLMLQKELRCCTSTPMPNALTPSLKVTCLLSITAHYSFWYSILPSSFFDSATLRTALLKSSWLMASL